MKKILKHTLFFLFSCSTGVILATLFSFDFISKKNSEVKELKKISFSKTAIINDITQRLKINETIDKEKKFPPSVLTDRQVTPLTKKDKKILKYWVLKRPEDTMNWVNSQKIISFKILQHIYPIWLMRDSQKAISWFFHQNNKDQLNSLLVKIALHGNYDDVINLINKEYPKNQQKLWNNLLPYFIDRQVTLKNKRLIQWIEDKNDDLFLKSLLYYVAKNIGIKEANALLAKSKPQLKNIKKINNIFYKQIYSGYFLSNIVRGFNNIIENKDPYIYIDFLYHHHNIIFKTFRNKKNLKKLTDKSQLVLNTLKNIQQLHNNKKTPQQFEKEIKKIKNIDLKKQAYTKLLLNDTKNFFQSYPQKSLAIIKKYQIKNTQLLTKYLHYIPQNNINFIANIIITSTQIFNSSIYYKILAKIWVKRNKRDAVKFTKVIINEEYNFSYLTTLIKESDSKDFDLIDFKKYCHNIKNKELSQNAYIELSKKILSSNDKKQGIELFIQNYNKDSQIIDFFIVLLQEDLNLAESFIKKYAFSQYTKAILIGLLAYYDNEIEFSAKNMPQSAKEKISLAKALQKYADTPAFISYLNTLDLNNKNRTVAYYNELLKKK